MRQRICRLIGLFLFVCSTVIIATPLVAADAPPLHARIDTLLESTVIGALPPQSDDGEFLRRVYLDLIGVIPTVGETRAFLDDKSADKRTKVVDKLLADPRYVRWLATTFDVTLMERRPEKVVKVAEWQEYLYRAIAENRPYNVLVRELLSADTSKDKVNPPASRFILDRDVEPNLLTRDVGRLFFGMDLQCAQCHDHPVIDDYFQADYYGIYAFVNRTFLFTDKKDKKAPKFLAEKADGEASFKSVFTQQGADDFLPRLPKEPAIAEPVVAKGDEYFVKPDKDERPVPKYSRRQKLAELVGKGENTAFNRNIANRLWAHLFGRGIVHPVDFMHSDNPPSQPELLDLLANEFRNHKYDIKWFLRELALTRAYQRSSQLPAPTQIKFETVTAKLKDLEAEQAKCKKAVDAATAETDKLVKLLGDIKAPVKTPDAELAKLAAVKAAIAARDKAAKDAAEFKKTVTAKDDTLKLFTAAIAANQALAANLKSDKIVTDAAQQIAERQKAIAKESTDAKAKLATLDKAAKDLAEQATKAEQALATAKNPPKSGEGDKEKLGTALVLARNTATEARVKLKNAESRLNDAKSLLAYQQLMKSHKAAAERAWSSLIDSWTAKAYVTTLKPMAPEQFGLSLMQAVGQLEARIPGTIAAIDKKPPDELAKADEKKKPAIKAELIERKMYDEVKGNLTTIVNLYGGQPGQDFAATLNQSLFFGNGPLLPSLLRAQAGQLIDRLDKQADAKVLAEDLYLSVFTRRPTDREIASVADYLKNRQKEDRVAAIQEMTWALLASNEFRFNH
jgi:hypothetical protein